MQADCPSPGCEEQGASKPQAPPRYAGRAIHPMGEAIISKARSRRSRACALRAFQHGFAVPTGFEETGLFDPCFIAGSLSERSNPLSAEELGGEDCFAVPHANEAGSGVAEGRAREPVS